MTVEEAEAYHAQQIGIFAEEKADMVTVRTQNYVEEALGVVKAAKGHNIPVVVSFTAETDGRMPSG